MELNFTKNIMKTKRPNGRKQYTISIPEAIRQILQIPRKKTLYIYTSKTPGTYLLTTSKPNQEIHVEQRSIFPNGKLHYFTLPIKLLKDIPEEQINHVLFHVDFEQVDNITQQRGIISLNIE